MREAGKDFGYQSTDGKKKYNFEQKIQKYIYQLSLGMKTNPRRKALRDDYFVGMRSVVENRETGHGSAGQTARAAWKREFLMTLG